jgi:serine/threonine-protein kinase HipA
MTMQERKCLFCYKALIETESDYHAACSRKFFGTTVPPLLPYSEDEMYKLGEQLVRSQSAVTGVQPKLSLELEKKKNRQNPQRFTIVGLWGSYILKPPFELYPNLPELEDVTMHLASASGIETVPHSLIRLSSGSLAYITKRIDRSKNGKLHMEDMCQLTDRLTEHKYKGSYDQICKAILKYSSNPVLDVVNFFEQLVFSFLTGNADMHLKNFSLIKKPEVGWTLSPAYDLVPTALVVEGDTEEMALNLNGKKRKIKMSDFKSAMHRCRIPVKAMENIFRKFENTESKWNEIIQNSFLPEKYKASYLNLINERIGKINPKEA